MDNFRVEITDNNRRFVMFRHTRLGEIMAVDDGEYVFFPKPQREGFWRSWLMKAIVEKFIANGKYARIAWDDEGASTVLVANIAKTKSSIPSTGMQYQEELRVKRALLGIDAAIIAKQTWAQLTD